MKYSEITTEYLNEKYPGLNIKERNGLLYKQYIRPPIIAYAINSTSFADEEVDEEIISLTMSIFNSVYNYGEMDKQLDDDIETRTKKLIEHRKNNLEVDSTITIDACAFDNMLLLLDHIPMNFYRVTDIYYLLTKHCVSSDVNIDT